MSDDASDCLVVVKQHNRENDVAFLDMMEDFAKEEEENKYDKPPYLRGSVEEHIGYTYSNTVVETRPVRRTMCGII